MPATDPETLSWTQGASHASTDGGVARPHQTTITMRGDPRGVRQGFKSENIALHHRLNQAVSQAVMLLLFVDMFYGNAGPRAAHAAGGIPKSFGLRIRSASV